MKHTLLRIVDAFRAKPRPQRLDAALMAGQDGGQGSGPGQGGGSGGPNGGPNGGPPVPPQNQRGGQQVFTFVMIAAMVGLVILALQSFSKPKDVTWARFKELVEQRRSTTAPTGATRCRARS